MNIQEMNLVVLMEECAEVIQAIHYVAEFGPDYTVHGKDRTTGQHLRDEILDVMACTDFLTKYGQIERIDLVDVDGYGGSGLSVAILYSNLYLQCSSIIQRASKQLRFGRDEIQPNQFLPNHARLRNTILGFFASVHAMAERHIIERIDLSHIIGHIKLREDKFNATINLSRELGRLTDTPTAGQPV